MSIILSFNKICFRTKKKICENITAIKQSIDQLIPSMDTETCSNQLNQTHMHWWYCPIITMIMRNAVIVIDSSSIDCNESAKVFKNANFTKMYPYYSKKHKARWWHYFRTNWTNDWKHGTQFLQCRPPSKITPSHILLCVVTITARFPTFKQLFPLQPLPSWCKMYL